MSNALGGAFPPYPLAYPLLRNRAKPWPVKIKEDPEALIDMLLTTFSSLLALFRMLLIKATIFDKTTAQRVPLW